MGRTVAVITDALSAGEFFPYWHRYYGGLFGPSNLYVLTLTGRHHRFAGFELGRLLEAQAHYSNAGRAEAISGAVRILLGRYDVVIRCDVDEFLVADPRRHASLANYVETLDQPYVTASGLDVLDCGEPPLRLDDAPLLAQRSYCVGTMSLNKTAIVRRPLRWTIGFHSADAPPRFDDLYLLHMKFADVERRLGWFAEMRAAAEPGSFEEGNYRRGQDSLRSTTDWLRSLPRRHGWDAFADTAFQRKFLSVLAYEPGSPFYSYPFDFDPVLRRMPDEIRAIL